MHTWKSFQKELETNGPDTEELGSRRKVIFPKQINLKKENKP